MSSETKILRNMLEFGIDLALETEDENIFYALEFANFVQSEEGFESVMTSESSIEVYSLDTLLITVIIENGILMIEPHTEEGSFEAVLVVLKFVSEMHNEVKDRYKKLNTEETLDLTEENSEDDSEWI